MTDKREQPKKIKQQQWNNDKKLDDKELIIQKHKKSKKSNQGKKWILSKNNDKTKTETLNKENKLEQGNKLMTAARKDKDPTP